MHTNLTGGLIYIVDDQNQFKKYLHTNSANKGN